MTDSLFLQDSAPHLLKRQSVHGSIDASLADKEIVVDDRYMILGQLHV